MTKQQHFILAAQTGIIIRGALLSTQNPTQTMLHALGVLEEAVRAADHIPDDMSANEAACEFLHYLYDVPESERDPEAWFMRKRNKPS